MPDPTVSNLLGLLFVVSQYVRAASLDSISTRAISEKQLHVTSPMLSRLCRLGYLRLETDANKEHRYRITDAGRTLLSLPLFERHEEFLRRKEVHPEGHSCCVCGFSGPGLTRFQKKDYCPRHLNVEYKPVFIYREGSSLSWES